MKELIPHPSALIHSMRSFGYRPHTALADLVDNSITAGASSISIDLSPSHGAQLGWVRVVDDGKGMTSDELYEAMRWGGRGPNQQRKANDLGRFGLGLKTASLSMGKRLTVISAVRGSPVALRWDLDVVEKTGKWTPLEGIDDSDLHLVEREITALKKQGTIVLVTALDKLRVDAFSEKHQQANRSGLIEQIRNHLRLVYHRFLDSDKVTMKLGASKLSGWNLFSANGRLEEPSWLKSKEHLSNKSVEVRTFILPHHKALTPEQHEILGGPLGWNAHQGFIIYRAGRMIRSGGWLGFSKPEEHCKLARVAIDLPNASDDSWGLDVIKSKVTPPAILLGDIERIARAARKDAAERYRVHGEKDATTDEDGAAFWKQLAGNKSVFFRINRGHPLVEALVQSVARKEQGEAFLHAFERTLPISAILQQPAKTTHGLVEDPSIDELRQLAIALKLTADLLRKTGMTREEALASALECTPFARLRNQLERYV